MLLHLPPRIRAGRSWTVVSLLLALALSPPTVSATQPAADTSRSERATTAFAPEAGRLLRRYLDPDVYGASRQNWDAAQDSSGVLYVTNTEGVLAYDGHSWHTIPTPRETGTLSITADDEGRVYVGSSGDFGVLRTDSLGQKHFASLLDQVPKSDRSFHDISRTVTTDEGVYFQSPQRLFRWTPETETMKVWSPPGKKFHFASVVRDTLYVNVERKGLMSVHDDSLRLVPNGATFADRSIRFVLPRNENGLLLGTFRGLFVREGGSFRAFQTDADALLREAWLYAGERLHDGTIAIGTIDHGLLLLGPNGETRRRLHARGKPVTGLYEDREGGLWALLDGGMLRYDVGAPFTEFTNTLDGIVLDIVRHNRRLYAATTQATYRLQTAADSSASFRPVPALKQKTRSTPSWALSPGPDGLLVGTAYGIAHQHPDGTVTDLLRDAQVFDVYRSAIDSSRLFVASENGVRLYTRTRSGWAMKRRLDFDVNVRMLAEDKHGTLWVGTDPSRVYRVRGLSSSDSVTVDRFDAEHGLPHGDVAPYRWNGEVVFGTGEGVFRFVSSPTPHFVPHPGIEAPPIGEGEERTHVYTDAFGRTWGTTGEGPGRWKRRRDSTWHWAPGALSRLRNRRVESLHLEDGGRTLWWGTWGGAVIRHVPGSGWPRADVDPLISRVSAYETDSLLALGGASGSGAARPHTSGGIRISYGVPSLVRPDAIEYQYKLAGENGSWSSWTSRTEQTYRRLSPGSYSFAVRARLAYGDTTQSTRYAFTVLPPWYRTWWAYGFYLLAASGLVAGVVQWRTRQLRRRQEELQRAVARRTREIQQQKEQLANQAERLEELDEAKSRFFANVSHEFRTPLTLILGPAEDLRDSVRQHLSEADLEHMNVIERNAQRLLRLVDQILGIARMEAGTYRLDARPTDVPTEVERITRSFEPLAERGALTLVVNTPAANDASDEREPVYVDREALEHIIGNLLSNAIKFTPKDGTITVTVTEHTDTAQVAVADTGPGLSEEEQATIFDRFQQAQPSSGAGPRNQEGAGIGLAFVRDLVDLHEGTIVVDSTNGEGATFTVRFRRGRTHLPDAHVDDRSSPTPPSSDDVALPSPDDAPSSELDASSTSDGFPPSADVDDQKKRVLVVDDNADVRQYVRSILEPAFHVIEAAHGAQGLDRAQEALPDVILADVMMPEMDGREMTRHLKEIPETAAIPVILVTARAGTGDEVEGLKAGADDYVTKPFDASVLRQRVDGVIAFQERLRKRLQTEAAPEPTAPPDDEDEPCSELEREARRTIQHHLTDSDFDASDLARELAMSRSALYRAFEEETDTTPSALITEVRMERAVTLLQEEMGTVTQIAYAVGYEQLSSFSRAFREHTGRCPSAVAA